jgi:transmembrane sensor
MTYSTDDGLQNGPNPIADGREDMNADLFDPKPEHYKAAADWLARLREPGPSVTRAFEAWKAERPAHAFAFAEVEALFDAATVPAREAAEAATHLRLHTHHHPLGWAVAASLLIAVLAISQVGRLRDLGTAAATAPGATRQIALADGTAVTLNTRSALDVTDARSVRLRRGEAYFAVAKDAAHPFTVDAGPARVQVLGTHFNVRRDGDQVVVGVDEGRVRVTPLDHPERAIILSAGQEGLADARGAQRQALDPLVTGSWRRGQLVFYQTPLRAVVRDLNRYRAAPILIANRSLADDAVSGVFATRDPAAATAIISRTLSVRAVTLPGGVTIIY